MAYFTLIQRNHSADGLWHPQFGAHDREDVELERDDLKAHGAKAVDLRIIQTGSSKSHAINARIAEINKTAG